MALAGSRPARIDPLAFVASVRVLHPAPWVMDQLGNAVLRTSGARAEDEVTSASTRDEVAGLVQESPTAC